MSKRSRRNAPEVCALPKVIGKIKSVYCKDFVTYAECTFHPTEYLNVIIGPNGTGKSTLVSAIVLGLGGEPKLLSRSSAIQDYIKNGQTSSIIDVEIYANEQGKMIHFRRCFNDSGKSDYRINEEIVSKNKFLAEVAVYKIQIGNLCQFLPQDRVQDFAKMNPQEILVNTINSVCSQHVIDNFAKLKDLRKSQTNSKKTLEKDMIALKESMTRQEELNQILQRYNARNEYMVKLDICNSKRLWLEVEEIKSKTKEYATDLKSAKKKFEEHKNVYEEIMKKQSEINRIAEKLTLDAEKREKSVSPLLEKRNAISKQIEELKKKIREEKTSYDKMKRDKADRDNDLLNETRILQVIIQDLSNAKTDIGFDTSTTEEINKCQQELNDMKSEIAELFRTRSEINKKIDEEYTAEIQMLQRRIDIANNVFEQKLKLLRNKFADLYTAVQWLRDNNELFEGKVYNPMILELNVRDPNHTKYFENTIPMRDLLAFTCENKSDMSKLVDELRIKQNLSINVCHSAAADRCEFRPNEPIANLRKFGFTAYLVDLIEGPPAILNYLCSLYKLHNIPIGSEQVNNNTDSIPHTIRQYFGGDRRYNATISKYSKELSLVQSHITGKQLLCSKDVNEVQMLKKRLSELTKKTDALKSKRSAIESKVDEIEAQRREVSTKKRAIDAKLVRLEQLNEKFKRQKRKVTQLKNDSVSLPELEQKFTKTVQECLTAIMKFQKQKISVLGLCQNATADKMFAQTKVRIYKQENEAQTNAINEANDNKRRSENLVETITNTLEGSKRKYKVKIAEAQALTNNCKPTDANFPNKDAFNQLPNNLEELKAAIDDYSARLDFMGDVDQGIVSEYESKRNDVDTLKKLIEETLNKDQTTEEEIKSIFSNWYPEIIRIVETLNKHFGEFMESMSYVGEVLLARQNDFDFDSYGIQIMVQYRNNVPLQALDRHVQSGGERAVAIAVYTLSLQHITHVPFRCVDEINQGMDARNERKIFEMLVEETTKSGSAQYFFVTPKLLPNLPFNDRMTVHVVFNGKMMQPRNAFSCIM